nr:hypothetical protein [Pseudobutyrivibrio sp.]
EPTVDEPEDTTPDEEPSGQEDASPEDETADGQEATNADEPGTAATGTVAAGIIPNIYYPTAVMPQLPSFLQTILPAIDDTQILPVGDAGGIAIIADNLVPRAAEEELTEENDSPVAIQDEETAKSIMDLVSNRIWWYWILIIITCISITVSSYKMRKEGAVNR